MDVPLFLNSDGTKKVFVQIFWRNLSYALRTSVEGEWDKTTFVRSFVCRLFKKPFSPSLSFRCPNAGEYLVDMRDFVESYQEAKELANEAKCESASYTCELNCQNGNYAYQAAGDDYNGNENDWCAYQCLVKQGKAIRWTV
jgi:hypothetical protein